MTSYEDTRQRALEALREELNTRHSAAAAAFGKATREHNTAAKHEALAGMTALDVALTAVEREQLRTDRRTS